MRVPALQWGCPPWLTAPCPPGAMLAATAGLPRPLSPKAWWLSREAGRCRARYASPQHPRALGTSGPKNSGPVPRGHRTLRLAPSPPRAPARPRRSAQTRSPRREELAARPYRTRPAALRRGDGGAGGGRRGSCDPQVPPPPAPPPPPPPLPPPPPPLSLTRLLRPRACAVARRGQLRGPRAEVATERDETQHCSSGEGGQGGEGTLGLFGGHHRTTPGRDC